MINRIRAWSDKNSIISHSIIGIVLGISGAKFILEMGGPWYWAYLNGIIWAAIAITAQEQTDERAHHAIKNFFVTYKLLGDGIESNTPTIWNGWDWKDWLGGIIGGSIGSLLTSWLWA